MQSRTCTHTKRRHTAGSAHTAGHSSGAHRQMHRHTRENPTSPAWRRLCMWGISLGQWERDESGAIAHTHTIPGGERKRWKLRDRTEAWRGKEEKKQQPTPIDHTAGTHVQSPPTPAQYSPCSCKTGTCVRGWSFFCALLWLAACRCVGENRGGGREGGNERVKTKTEWVSMRVLDTHAKKNQTNEM